MKLWFENSNGDVRVIADCATWQEVSQQIDIFIAQCNEKKTAARKAYYGDQYDPSRDNPFVRYYTRVWQQQDGKTRIDVGSHTEFFIWEGQYDARVD